MASLLDFLGAGNGSGLLGNLQPPQPAQPQQGAPDQSGGFATGLGNFLSSNPLMLMALGGGIAQGGIGRGLQMAVPAAQAERKERKQDVVQGITYDALRTAGVPHGQALAGALNPEILKTIARAQFETRPSFQTVGYDEHGQPAYGFVDASRMAVTPYQQPAPGPLSSMARPGDAAAGKAATKQISSINSIIGRFGNLIDASEKLDNVAAAASNDAVGAPASPGKATREDLAAGQFDSARGALANDMTRLLGANGMSENEIRSWKEKLLGSNSRAELRAAIGSGVDLINARLAGLKEQYERAVGRDTPDWLPPKSRTALEKVRQWAKEESPE